jgi:hypothetical protein
VDSTGNHIPGPTKCGSLGAVATSFSVTTENGGNTNPNTTVGETGYKWEIGYTKSVTGKEFLYMWSIQCNFSK